MSLEVNRVEARAAEAGAAPAREPGAVEGELYRGRSGPLRVVQWLTGVALLLWIARGLGWLLGWRHGATLTLGGSALELRGQRTFFGIPLGGTRELIPLQALRRVTVAPASPLWAVMAAFVALVLAAAAATVLVLWGIAGRQPSWIGLGAAIIGGGVFLDCLAFLLVRRAVARGRVNLELHAAGRRLRLSGATQRTVDGLLDRLHAATGPV